MFHKNIVVIEGVRSNGCVEHHEVICVKMVAFLDLDFQKKIYVIVKFELKLFVQFSQKNL